MGTLSGDRVLGEYLYFRFHRSSSHVTHFGVDDDQVADADGLPEDHRVDGNSHHLALRMSHASQCTAFVDKLHDPTAMDVAQQVGMFGMHELRNGDARGANRFGTLCHDSGSLFHEFTISPR